MGKLESTSKHKSFRLTGTLEAERLPGPSWLRTALSMLVFSLGAVIVTYGITRWFTTRALIADHESIVVAVQKERTLDISKNSFSLKEVSEDLALIREKIFHSQGPYQWMSGLLLTLGIGFSTFAVGTYIWCREFKGVSDGLNNESGSTLDT
jgi:hypothetical protein